MSARYDRAALDRSTPVTSGSQTRRGAQSTVAVGTTALIVACTTLLFPGLAYDGESSALHSSALAQDLVTVVVVAPLLGVLWWWGRTASSTARLLRLGVLMFLVYNFAIYCFSVQFGPMFLPWVFLFGASLFALVLEIVNVKWCDEQFTSASRWVGWALVALACVFSLLWLSEIVPDLLAGRPSSSAGDWNVPTNPVHVLDLAVFLPVVFLSGCSLSLRGRFGGLSAPGMLVFLALTCAPILATPLVQTWRSEPAGWAPFVPVLAVLIVCLVALRSSVRWSRHTS